MQHRRRHRGSEHAALAQSRRTARGGVSKRGFRKNGVFDECHRNIGRRMTKRKIQRRGMQSRPSAEGKRALRVGARMSIGPAMHRAGHIPMADDQLHLPMNQARHKTCRDQSTGNDDDQRKRYQALARLRTTKHCPWTTHTRVLCSTDLAHGKRRPNARRRTPARHMASVSFVLGGRLFRWPGA